MFVFHRYNIHLLSRVKIIDLLDYGIATYYTRKIADITDHRLNTVENVARQSGAQRFWDSKKKII